VQNKKPNVARCILNFFLLLSPLLLLLHSTVALCCCCRCCFWRHRRRQTNKPNYFNWQKTKCLRYSYCFAVPRFLYSIFLVFGSPVPLSLDFHFFITLLPFLFTRKKFTPHGCCHLRCGNYS